MFIIVQIPFVDLRLINSNIEDIYFFPHTFKDKMNYHSEKQESVSFYRYLGQKNYRKNSNGVEISEKTFFSDNRLLKISEEFQGKYKIIFTRMFADKMFFHFDVGIIVNTHNYEYKLSLNEIVNELFTQPVLNVRQVKPCKNISDRELKLRTSREYSMLSLPKYIGQLYLYATTKVLVNYPSNMNDLISFGTPTVLCETDSEEVKIKHGEFARIDDENVRSLLVKSHIIKNGRNFQKPVNVWVYGETKFKAKDLQRNFRICLLKYNCYLQGFLNIFDFLEKSDFNCKNFKNIFTEKLYKFQNMLSKSSHYGYDTEKIYNIAFKTTLGIDYQIWDNHKDKIDFCIKKHEEHEEYEKRKSDLLNEIQILMQYVVNQNNENMATIQAELKKIREQIENDEEPILKKENKSVLEKIHKFCGDVGVSTLASMIAALLLSA